MNNQIVKINNADLLVKDFELASKVIINWQPNRELELMIRGCNTLMRNRRKYK
ncbi:MAG: hypothetical protein KH415_18900 [Clostridium sp.]|nr:hypothetical protein [Clostridium sp.]